MDLAAISISSRLSLTDAALPMTAIREALGVSP